MNHEQFDKLVEEQIISIRKVLISKAAEYAKGGDRLHNFRVAARKLGRDVTSAQALRGMDIKHVVSIDDMVIGGLPATLRDSNNMEYIKAYIDEKIGDHINYMILLKACLYSEYNIHID